MHSLILSYLQYFYMRLQIRKASVITTMPSLADIEFEYGSHVNFITNIIFYGTIFFLLYIIKKKFIKLIEISIESTRYENNYPHLR